MNIPDNEFGERVARRLREERIIWLTTLRKDGTPQPTPVWFYWNSDTFLIFSEPNTQKLRNLAAHPKVALHFDGDGEGGNIVVIWGEAMVGERPSQEDLAAYLEKYQDGLKRIQMTAQDFTGSYTVPIRIRPIHLRGH